jgi:hypothetical protein
MKIREKILVAIPFLIPFYIAAQSNIEDDVIILKDGKQYVGRIVEQSPGKSIRFVENSKTDTLTFFIPQIDKLKKQPRKEEKLKEATTTSTPIEININNTEKTINSIGNDLTVFSDMGYRFALYINGKRYNENFESSVTVENINHNWIKLSVLFEDPDKGIIEKNLSLSPVNENLIPYTSTYRIYVNRNNKIVLGYYESVAKKIAPGSGTVIIDRGAPPSGVNFKINHSTHISR